MFGTPPEVDDKNELVPDRILFLKKRGEYQMGGVFVKHQVSLKNKKKFLSTSKKEEELEWKRMTQRDRMSGYLKNKKHPSYFIIS